MDLTVFRYECSFCKMIFWTDREVMTDCPFCGEEVGEGTKEQHLIKETNETE